MAILSSHALCGNQASLLQLLHIGKLGPGVRNVAGGLPNERYRVGERRGQTAITASDLGIWLGAYVVACQHLLWTGRGSGCMSMCEGRDQKHCMRTCPAFLLQPQRGWPLCLKTASTGLMGCIYTRCRTLPIVPKESQTQPGGDSD